MKIIGVTGGVGCGKSTVLDIIKAMESEYSIGVCVYKADDIAKSMYVPGNPAYEEIVVAFGACILMPDGSIDKNKLASIIFNSESSLALINNIVHPKVEAYIRKEIAENADKDFIFIESAILFDTTLYHMCDELWFVTADRAVREGRLMTSRGYSREKISSIMDSQLSESEYIARCNVVIDNSGTSDQTKAALVKLLMV